MNPAKPLEIKKMTDTTINQRNIVLSDKNLIKSFNHGDIDYRKSDGKMIRKAASQEKEARPSIVNLT